MKVRLSGLEGTSARRTLRSFGLSAPSTIDDLDRTGLRLSALSLLEELGLKVPVEVGSEIWSPLNAEEN